MTQPDLENGAPGNGARVKFQAIVEAAGRDGDAAPAEDAPAALAADSDPPLQAVALGEPRRNWNAASRQVWQASRLGAILIFSAIVCGWPLGAYWSHVDLYGGASGWTETLLSTLSTEIVFIAVFVPVLILLCGYLLSRAYTMLDAAESIASAAQQFVQPDRTAARNVEAVGYAVRGQVEALNTGVDGALQRLAAVEAMIRQHVKAIETAGAAIQSQTSGAVDRVATERSRLIDLTENLNSQADAFAAAIAERAQQGVAVMTTADDQATAAETRLEERLSRLEQAASKALDSFKALDAAIDVADGAVRDRAAAMETTADAARRSSEAAAAQASEAVEAAKRSAGEIEDSVKSVAYAAVDAAKTQTDRLREETGAAIKSAQETSRQSVDAAAADAAKAIAAAGEASAAAKQASDAATQAGEMIGTVGERIKADADKARSLADDANSDLERRSVALAQAREILEKENARLETLIEEQKTRADKLAETIALQTQRLSKLADDQAKAQEAIASAETPTATVGKPDAAPSSAAASRVAPNAAPKAAPAEKNGGNASSVNGDTDILQLGRAMRRETSQPRESSPAHRPDADRLDALARDIAAQRAEKSAAPRAAAATSDKNADKSDVSWKQILDATDDAEPLDLAAASKSPPEEKNEPAPEIDAIKIITDLQGFTRDLETRLYGDPPPALRERFDRGDRNVFANRILRLNEADVKRRIRMESGRDKAFETSIHQFLQGFENLLEDATTSETADEELEEYLSSPLGRVYLLIGATVGYFA
ncbi:MAG: hypothetical protein AAGJ87_04210 [Pseudomonadota bacterium]